MKKEPIAVLGLLLMLFFGLGACKKAETPHKASGVASINEAETGNYFTLRLNPKWHPQAQFAGVYMALKHDFYADHNLKLKILPYEPIEQQMESVRAGNSEIFSMDLLQALKKYHDTKEFVIIGQTAQSNSVLLVGRKSRGIRSVEDFKGKKLGIWRSSSNEITRSYLQDHKIDMEMVPIEWSINLFTQGAVDVMNVMSYNEYHQLLQAGIPEDDLFVFALDMPGYNIPDDGFYVSADFYKQHPRECQAFIEATMDGWTYAFTHPVETLDEIMRIMQEAKIRANRAHQNWMLQGMKKVIMANPASMGKLDKQDFDNAVHLLKRTQAISGDIKYEEFYPGGQK